MSTAVDLLRTGVTVACSAPADINAIADIVGGAAIRLGATLSPPSGEAIAALGFDLDGRMSAVIVREMPADTLEDRPEISTLLDDDIARIIRIEMVTLADSGQAAVRADHAVVSIIVSLAARLNVVACDDIGALYDLDELRELDTARAGRFESDAFLIETARRSEQAAFAAVAGEATPVAPGPDAALTAIIPLVGLRVPALTWVAVLRDPSIAVAAPSLDAIDIRALQQNGVRFSAALDGLPVTPETAVDGRARDEVDLHFAVTTTAADIARVVEEVAIDWAAADAARDGSTAAETVTISGRSPSDEGTVSIATLLFGRVTCNVTLIGASFDARSIAALRGRGDITALLGAPAASIVAIDFSDAGDPVDEALMRRADAFSVALAAAFAKRFGAVATDLGGATYTAAMLQRMAARHETRDGSWPALVASAIATA